MDPAMPLGLWLLPLLLVGSACSFASASAQGNNLEICLLPLETGPCRALISRFYYDRNQQRCRKFKYGGCLGNANNFQSRELCEHTCGNIEKVPTVCRLELKTYPCDKPNVQYFFSLTTMTCEPLSPDLCSKTMNIFPDENTCKNFCEPRKSSIILLQPKR
ncbi:Tissue factor pathway inhibitor 2 [Lemmus lemmus]